MINKITNNLHLRGNLPFLLILVAGLVLVISHWLLVNNAESAVGINKQLNYQGKLADSGGSAVTDGNYNIKYVIYDSLTGGNCLWTALGACDTSDYQATSTTVTNGIFSVNLGGVGQNSLATSSIDFNDDSLYLGITVENDSEMAPRRRIGATAYAFNADTVDGIQATSTANVASYLLSLDSLGNFNLYTGGASSTKATTTWATTTDRLYIEGQIAVATTTPYANTKLAVTGNVVIDGNATTTGSLYVTDDLTAGGNLQVGTYADIPATDGTIFLAHFNNVINADRSAGSGTATFTGPEGVWHFEDGTGTSATDDSGLNNTLTLYNTPTWTTDSKYGTALDFESSSSEYGAQTSDDVAFDPQSGDFTVGAWIKLETLPSDAGNTMEIMVKENNIWNGWYFDIINTGNNLRLYIGSTTSNANNHSCSYAPGFVVDTWYFVSASWDASTETAVCGVNGTYSSWTNGDLDVGDINSTANLQLGRNDGDSNYFDGIIDEPFFIKGAALTQTEFDLIYNNQWLGQTYFDGKFGNGYNAMTGNSLSYPTAGNIVKDKGTIEMWVKSSWGGGDNNSYTFFDTNTTAHNNEIEFFKFGGSGFNHLFFQIEDSSSTASTCTFEISDSANQFATSSWYHIAATWNNGEPTGLYLEGELVGSCDDSHDGFEQLDTTMYIGTNSVGANDAQSIIDEFRISDRALTESEIKRSYLSDFEHFDIAEHFQSGDSLEAGDLVVLDTSLGNDYVARTNTPYNPLAIGVVSTQPGIVLGGANYNPETRVPIALAGRVPIKVSTVNGSISAGDMLTASRIPGHAMKATESSSGVIGMALESFSEENGKIMMLIKQGGMNLDQNYTPLLQSEHFNNIDLANISSIQSLTVMDTLYTNKLVVNDLAEFYGGISVIDSNLEISGGKLIVDSDTAGTATILAGEVTVDISFDKEYGYTPKVTASPKSNLSGSSFWISNNTVNGFTINISHPQNQEISFDWIALATNGKENQVIVVDDENINEIIVSENDQNTEEDEPNDEVVEGDEEPEVEILNPIQDDEIVSEEEPKEEEEVVIEETQEPEEDELGLEEPFGSAQGEEENLEISNTEDGT